jgi:hypothetical protein
MIPTTAAIREAWVGLKLSCMGAAEPVNCPVPCVLGSAVEVWERVGLIVTTPTAVEEGTYALVGAGLGLQLGRGLGLGLEVHLELNVGVAFELAVVELSPLSVVVARQRPAGWVVEQSAKAQVITSMMPSKPLVIRDQPAVICETSISGTFSSLSTMERSSMALKSSRVSLTMASAPSMRSDGIVRAMPTRPVMRSVISLGRFSIRVGTWPDLIWVKKRSASFSSFSRISTISQGIWSRRPMILLERKRPQIRFLDLIRRELCGIFEQTEERRREEGRGDFAHVEFLKSCLSWRLPSALNPTLKGALCTAATKSRIRKSGKKTSTIWLRSILNSDFSTLGQMACEVVMNSRI